MSRVTTDKEAFFKGLEQLDSITDDSEGEFDRLISASLPRDRKAVLRHSRSVTDPSPSVSAAGNATIGLSKESPIDIEGNRPKAMAGSSERRPVGSNAPGKRKRGSSGPVIPARPQIFKGLVFCM
ncbi:hypothetical protein P175DRAFT_0499066 [Aspergillus ochraceoroseus IBT 24754]|uniref:Uncharacterized protein n=1 Tax=Aspergillus ochraceoroseus IBT 24754 TaxID=1392256 RepID=A0A2T5M1X6_9EURO|nr:uncharacterized protein P175DRAFT_0499066 [Aspergillus ochraceoroseus IBT 24754]PTU22540.1 hypothetical protein P175DRAFT_0499066 [Aspergillus ochraceoroseus IBT 24754]